MSGRPGGGRRRAVPSRVGTVVSGLVMMLGSSPLVRACAVCLKDPESPLTRGLNAGIAVLLGVVVVTLGGFATAIIGFIRRSRRLEAASSQRLEGGLAAD